MGGGDDYLFRSSLRPMSASASLTRISIAAGALVGHLGEYKRDIDAPPCARTTRACSSNVNINSGGVTINTTMGELCWLAETAGIYILGNELGNLRAGRNSFNLDTLWI